MLGIQFIALIDILNKRKRQETTRGHSYVESCERMIVCEKTTQELRVNFHEVDFEMRFEG